MACYVKPNGDPWTFSPQDDAEGRKWTWEENGYTVIRTHARTGPGCHSNCGILLYVKDGKIEYIEGDPENPFNQGRLCPRCLAVTEMMYHPDRLTYPMKRTGPRGSNQWERISWDDAYDLIERKLKQIISEYGAESVWVNIGTGRDINGYLGRLAYSMNTPNIGSFMTGNSCYVPRVYMCNQKMGTFVVADCSQFFPGRYEDPRYQIPEYVLIWGSNPVYTNSDGFLGHWIVELMKRGTKLITVDPRLTWLASRSEWFLQIRPGTDSALALAIGHVIILEGLYDQEFVGTWTNGFEKYRERVLAYPPERVAMICGISEDLIWEAARTIGKARSVALQWGVAIDHSMEPIYTSAALLDLMALTGNIEKPGTMVTASPAFGVRNTWQGGWGIELLDMEQKEKKLNQDYPYAGLVGSTMPQTALKAGLTGNPYPIKACWIETTNPLANTAQEPERVLKLLQQNEFNVVVDLFMTPTALACADVILPAACYAERPGLCGHQPYFLGAIVKAVEPPGECRSDQQIIYEMSRRFRSEENPWKKDEELYDSFLEPLGITYEQMKRRTWAYPEFEYGKHEKGLLRKDGKPGFATESGKYEFCNPALEALGYDPLPAYYEPPCFSHDKPEADRHYPLILITGARRPEYFLSEHKQSPSLRRMHPDPTITIHPKTAEKFGVGEGDWVFVENQRGRARMKVEISLAIREDVVSADSGWWYPERDASDGSLYGTFESNINVLIEMKSGITGFGSCMNSERCRIYPTDKDDR